MTSEQKSLIEAAELRSLAEQARSDNPTWWLWDEPRTFDSGPMLLFASKATPEQIIALCDRVEQLERTINEAIRIGTTPLDSMLSHKKQMQERGDGMLDVLREAMRRA